MQPIVNNENVKMRLDIWLWSARFYKTRQMANRAIQLGRVLIQGSKVKPSRMITLGTCLSIRREQMVQTVTIKDLSARRVSAPLAVQLYIEDPSSIALNNDIKEKLKLSALSTRYTEKPSKQDRKQRIKIKRLGG
jgi:ribosome-associated heat shock protein Hsp15